MNSQTGPGTPSSSTSAASTSTAPAPLQNAQLLENLRTLIQQQTGKPFSTEQVLQIFPPGADGAVLAQHLRQLLTTGRPGAPGTTPHPANSKPTGPQAEGAVATPGQLPGTQPNPTSSALYKSGIDTTFAQVQTSPAENMVYPISQTLNTSDPGPVPWQQTRPTLTGGLSGGRISGTPSQIARADDGFGTLSFEDTRAAASARKRSTAGDQSMRRTIQDLVASVDPGVKIEGEVEDLLLSIADEFIDSVTNFSCRLAKHRGGDALEVRDLQLHLERNHNIRIPGFASDEARISLSQSAVAPPPPAPSKKATGPGAGGGTHMTLRSQRLAQVGQAKREGKLV